MDARERSETKPVIRHAVRVLVIDAADPVLLFASKDDDGRPFWYPSGGGGEPGETAAETAHREVREETGLVDVDLGPELGWRRGLASWGGVTYDRRERWFLARVDECVVDTGGFTDGERHSITGHRRWTVDELADGGDRLVPERLDALVRSLLRDGPPAHPVDLGP